LVRFHSACRSPGAAAAHRAPDCDACLDGSGEYTVSLEFKDLLAKQIATAMNEPPDQLQPVELRTASGDARGKFECNRSAPDRDGRHASAPWIRNWSVQTLATFVINTQFECAAAKQETKSGHISLSYQRCVRVGTEEGKLPHRSG
jgi:hypothetical protein